MILSHSFFDRILAKDMDILALLKKYWR